jgi:hypothetical protein
MLPFILPGARTRRRRQAAVLAAALAVLAGPAAAQTPLAVGDSARGTLQNVQDRDTVRLQLGAGDSVDVGVFSHTQNWMRIAVTVRNPQGTEVGRNTRASRPHYVAPGAAEIVAAVIAPSTGIYTVVVGDDPNNGFLACPCSYTLRTRRAGPVLVSDGRDLYVNRVQGSGPVEVGQYTVRNVGVGSASFAVNLDSAGSWLGSDRPGGTVTGPNRQPVTVRMTASPGTLPMGVYDGTFSLDYPGDVWNGSRWYRAFLRLYDPAAVVLDSTTYTQLARTAVAPDGKVVVFSDRALVRMDPVTGVAEPWVTGLGPYAGGMAFGADSALYIGDWDTRRILRITPAGRVSTFFSVEGTPVDVEVLPDGTVFVAVDGTQIVRRSPDGEVATLVTLPASSNPLYGIAYLEGWIYYAHDGQLRRVNASTGVDQVRGPLPRAAGWMLWSLQAGASGRLYAVGSSHLLVLDDMGGLQGHLWPPGDVNSFALADGVIFGTSGAYMTWKLALDDGPARHDALVGDPSRDGQITSADALGVLSHVVGKPLPAGWSMDVRGDANCDGEVTAVDALIILSRVVEKDVSAFCVGGRR